MQANLCPDCLCPCLEVVLKKEGRYSCPLCGWQGKLGGRPPVFVSQEMEREMQGKLARKKAGQLYNVRVYVSTLTARGAGQVVKELISLFGSEQYAVDGEGNHRVLRVELGAKPTSIFVEKLKKLQGVIDVQVF
ncbi:hypothetical protein C4580_02810 [Candidatus Woesearchaeota archaeon]|nr:MAG: hypothetical protein C4580_02810 [Candidatus Woesearchaeota archaeon]